jgi:hypothetical protein
MTMSIEEERVWRFLLAHPSAEAGDIATACAVSLELAQSCLDRVGTPIEVILASAKSAQEEWVDDDILYVSASTQTKPTRVKTLETAISLTNGDRDKSYGPPINNLTDCAELWNAYIHTKQRATNNLELDAEDVAWMMVLVKMTRSFQKGYHPDNYTDASAYSAIAGECREILSKKDKE